MTDIAAGILSGRKASRTWRRLQRRIVLDEVKLIYHLLNRLKRQTQSSAIGAIADASRFTGYGLPVFPASPVHLGKGPLADIAPGLAWAQPTASSMSICQMICKMHFA